MREEEKATGWTEQDLTITPPCEEETLLVTLLRNQMAMTALWSVQWLEKEGLPWDFKEIRRKNWKRLDEGKQTVIAHLMGAFHQVSMAREYWAQENLEGTAYAMGQVGLSLGMASVLPSPYRGRGAQTYKRKKADDAIVILRADDRINTKAPNLTQSAKYDLVREDPSVKARQLKSSDATIRRLKRERASKP